MKNFFTSDEKNSSDVLESITQHALGLEYVSEADAPFTVFGGQQVSELNESSVREIAAIDGDKSAEEVPFDRFFERLTEIRDWYGDREKNIAKRFRELQSVLEEDLRDLTVFRFGSVQIDIIVVGIDREGRAVGLRTTAVET